MVLAFWRAGRATSVASYEGDTGSSPVVGFGNALKPCSGGFSRFWRCRQAAALTREDPGVIVLDQGGVSPATELGQWLGR